MHRARLLLTVATVAALIGSFAPTTGATTSSTPRWVTHVERFSGGISNGVRFSLDPAVVRAQGTYAETLAPSRTTAVGGNVQMNDDSYPPLPQNEESVAVSTDDPMVAVAGANDYVSGGTVVMRTSDGGRTWASTRVVPVFTPTSDICNGGDPSLAYSARDHAFYLAQLCFFRELPYSEVQILKSLDDGATWTPGRRSAIAASNFDRTTGAVDLATFNDKEYITVDNNPRSPYYGRLYVTWTRFHILSDGSSDTCPIKLAYTDTVPSQDPSLTTWKTTDVVADAPGAGGVGYSANQFSVPVVERSGALDIGYILEECNTSMDHGLRLRRSTNGGASFGPGSHVNKPGQWVDNPSYSDGIPHTSFRTPNTISLAYSPVTGTLAFVYANYLGGKGNGDIDVSLSHDGGQTWSDAIPISTGPGGRPARHNQRFPWIASDANGRFVAIWLDRRQDPANHDIGTFEAVSTDDGATWTDNPISTALWNPDDGFFKSAAFIGDYSGLAMNTQAIYPAWTDGRDSAIADTGIGETDVWTDVETIST
jgi:hypothetical protein